MPRRSGASWDGPLARPSTADCARPWTGTSAIKTGPRACSPAPTRVSGLAWGSTHDRPQGTHSRRRRGQPLAPAHARRQQTAVTSLRQADDLLSALHAYARGRAGDSDHLDTRRPAALSRAVG